MRTVAIISALGAIIGAAVYGVLAATSHVVSRSYSFGWSTFQRRYVDYLAVPSGSAGTTTSWWLTLLLSVGVGAAVAAVVGAVARLAGFGLSRQA